MDFFISCKKLGKRFEGEKSNNIWYLNAIFDQIPGFTSKCRIFPVWGLKRNLASERVTYL